MPNHESEKPLIVVDAGKVLIDFDQELVVRELAARSGRRIRLPLPGDLEELFLRAEVEGPAWRAIPAGLNRELGIALSDEEWGAIWCSMFTGEVPGMRQVLEELKRDFRLVALSNTCQVHWEFVTEKYPIFGLLDGRVVSYEEGAMKPDLAIYSTVMERYSGGGPPFFYTDDVPEYVEAARRMGWEAEVFRGADDLVAEVRRRCGVRRGGAAPRQTGSR